MGSAHSPCGHETATLPPLATAAASLPPRPTKKPRPLKALVLCVSKGTFGLDSSRPGDHLKRGDCRTIQSHLPIVHAALGVARRRADDDDDGDPVA